MIKPDGMNAVEDARYQPVFEADQRADRQKGFYSGGAGYRREYAALQLTHKNTELHPDAKSLLPEKDTE